MDSSTVVALAALVVAVVAVGVSVWEGVSTRRHNRLSVRPLMQLDFHNTDLRELSVVLGNRGLGPAILCSYTVRTRPDANGDSSVVDQRDLVQLTGVPFAHLWSPYPGEVVSPGEEITVFGVASECSFGSEQRLNAIKRMEGVTFSIEYESAYGETFTLSYCISEGRLAPV